MAVKQFANRHLAVKLTLKPDKKREMVLFYHLELARLKNAAVFIS